jgi:hypothetical protein
MWGNLMPSVSQTSVIMFALLVGFIVFITVRGELQSYLFILGLSATPGTGGNSVANQIDKIVAAIPKPS